MNTGLVLSPIDIRDYKLKTIDTNIPKEYFINTIPIKNQRTSPTCVPHVLSEIVEFHTFKDNNSFNRFSTEFIYGNRNETEYTSEGMYYRDGFRILKEYGDVRYEDLKGNSASAAAARKNISNNINVLKEKAYPFRISSYYKISSIEELKYSIYNYGPVAAAVRWQKDNIINGTYQFDELAPSTYHAVLIVGWNENELIIQNSWGRSFGIDGYFKIPYEVARVVIKEMYGVTDDIENIIKPHKTNWFVTLMNTIINIMQNINFL